MSPLFDDTPVEVEALYIEHFRRMPSWRKLEILAQMNRLVMSGLRQRYPYASEEELRRRLADLLLGPELAERVYGPSPQTAESQRE